MSVEKQFAACLVLTAAFCYTPVFGQTTPPAEDPSAKTEISGSATPKATGRYYIEFRVAQIGLYGHSYAAFGRLGARDQPATVSYADLHPMGNYALMALGHLVPVAANTEWDPDVLKLPVATKYRRLLTAAQYQNLLAAVRKARANKQPYWNAVSYNCNTFIGDLARAVGLRIPNHFQVSYQFVPALRELNESDQSVVSRSRSEKTM